MATGDSATEARDRHMSVEVTPACTEYGGVRFTFLDCPSVNPLEPITHIEVTTPSEFTSKVLQLVSGRRGQILGYEVRSDWQGWDKVTAYLPQAEMQNFIVELRSLTLGVGSFHWQYPTNLPSASGQPAATATAVIFEQN